MKYTQAADVTSTFADLVPAELQVCLYVTGTPDIAATPEQLAARPDAVRIDQSPDITVLDTTADILDVERYAGTDAEAPQWLSDARDDYARATRPGQRNPGFYRDLAGRDSLADALEAAGIQSGVPLWLAWWNIGLDAAAKLLDTTYRCFHIVGVQYLNGPDWDWDVFTPAWLASRSGPEQTPPPAPTPEEPMASLPQLQENSTGQHVRDCQALLNAHGHLLTLDGVFGPLTAQSVREFQAASGLAQDGIVGPRTWAALLDVPQPAS
jgi:hypothetical protein